MAHQKKLKEDLRSVWNEWSTPHDWGLWQDNPKPTAVEEVLGGADAPPEPDVGAEAGGAIELAADAPASPEPEHGHGQEHGHGHGSGSGSSHKEEEEEEEEGGGGGGGGGGAPKVPGFPGYTPSKAILQLAKKVRAGTASKETLVNQLKKVSFRGAKFAGEKAVKLATSLAHLFDGAVQAVGKVVAPPAKAPRAKSVAPAARAASAKPRGAAPPTPAPAPAPPAPKGSPAPAAPAGAAKELAEGVEAKTDVRGRTYYYKKGVGRIPASQAFK
jgi:hypothetical protein